MKEASMGPFSRIGIVSVSISTVFAPSAAAQESTQYPSIACATTGRVFNLVDTKERFLALHFLPAADDRAAQHVRQVMGSAADAAGVRHIFVPQGQAAAVKDWAATLKDHAETVYVDTGGALAQKLQVTAGSPTTVVLGRKGTELFRHTGKSAGEYPTWKSFMDQLSLKSRSPALTHYNLRPDRPLAVEGYDVVSYFKAGKAQRGGKDHQSTYLGVVYHFANEENRSLFASDPERYLPTYGGWCASAMGAKGTKVEIDPTNFKVTHGRLFLFYKGTFSDALKDWNSHEREWEPAADTNWNKLSGENPIRPSP